MSDTGVNRGGKKFQKLFNSIFSCLKVKFNALAKPYTWLIMPCIPWVKRSAFNFNIYNYISIYNE